LDEQPDRESEHSRSDSVAARVTEERLGPTEVEREKTDSSTGQRQSEQSDIVLTHPGADEGEPSGCDDGPLGDIAVEPVDEVHGVDRGHSDNGEGDDVGDSLSGEHRDDRAEQQSQDDLSDQSPGRAQGVEVVAHPDGRIAPGQDQETDWQEDASEAEDPVFADAPDHGENRGHGDAAADGDSPAAYGRQRM